MRMQSRRWRSNLRGHADGLWSMRRVVQKRFQMIAVACFCGLQHDACVSNGHIRGNTGHIVNISSLGSRFVWRGPAALIWRPRGRLHGFTEALRADLDGTGIGVTFYECCDGVTCQNSLEKVCSYGMFT